MIKIKNLKFNPSGQEIKNYSAGFTLIELLVTIMIFSLMTVLVVSIFVRAITIQRRIVAAAKIQENSTLLIESMAKEIRVSRVEDQDTLIDCSATTLTLIHPVNGNIVYSLSGGNVYKQITISGTTFTSIVNSSDVQFTRMNFCITGSAIDDRQAPKVTILLSLQNIKGEIVTADLQTTIVSRDISSELQQ